MKTYLSLFLFIVTTAAAAQEKFTLNVSMQPKRVYTTKSSITHSAEMYFAGDSTFMSQLEASGMTLPLVVTGTNEMQATTTTGKRKKDKTIPATIVYDRMTNTQTMNGQTFSPDNSSFLGAVIEGSFDQGARFNVDTIISETLDDNARNVMLNLLKSLQQQVAFPEYPIGVGDSFHQEVPLEVPVAGFQPMRMIIRSDFTLAELTKDKAIFDVIQSVELAMDTEEGEFEGRVTGGGKGVTEFDRKKEIMTRFETDMTMTMEMNFGAMKITADATSQVLQTVEME